MITTLRELLGRFRSVEDLELAAVVAHDGLLIESHARPGVDVDAICAVASNGLALAEALGREVSKGGALQTLLEYEQGLVMMEPITSEAYLLLMSGNRTSLGRLRFLAAKHREAMADALAAI